MDTVGEWRFGHEKGSQIGTRFAACTWIYKKAVVCNGQRHMETLRINKRNSIMMEAASWVSANCQDNHSLDLGILLGIAGNLQTGGIEL